MDVKSSRNGIGGGDRHAGMAASGKLRIDRMVAVYLGDTACHFDGIDVLPLRQFLGDLFAGRIF